MAVNTYRFLAIYIMVGIVMGIITAIQLSMISTSSGYDLQKQRAVEDIGNQFDNITNTGDQLAKTNQYVLQNTGIDEPSTGRNIIEVFRRGILPYGFMPQGEEGTTMGETLKTLNWIIILFRGIIMLFAGYEMFQIIIKPKVT